MDDIIDLLQIKIERARGQLSPDTLNAINTVDWKGVIFDMRERKGFSFEQLGNLEIETELVLCGLLEPKDYPKQLENRLKISKAEANQLVEEMNKLVFSKIKEELIKTTEKKRMFRESEEKDALVLKKAGIEIMPENNVPNAHIIYPKIEINTEKKIEQKPEEILKALEAQVEIQGGTSETKTIKGTEVEEKDVEEKKIEEVTDKKEGQVKENSTIMMQKLSNTVQTEKVKTEYTLGNITKTNGINNTNNETKIRNADPYREIPE